VHLLSPLAQRLQRLSHSQVRRQTDPRSVTIIITTIIIN
jgi:hypothetical protein